MAVTRAATPPRSAAATAMSVAPLAMDTPAAYVCSQPRSRGLSSATAVAMVAAGPVGFGWVAVTTVRLRVRRFWWEGSAEDAQVARFGPVGVREAVYAVYERRLRTHLQGLPVPQ